MSEPNIVPRTRIAAILILLVLATTVVLERWGVFEPTRAWWYSGQPTQPTVLFVVLDTVRSDHLGACGYARPTSATLDRLVADGAAFTCDAIAPGSWTLPSHASYFTGLTVPEHGSHFAAHSDAAIRGMHIRPLDPDLETVAEHWQAEGYQTAGLSGNPVLVEAAGVAQGFEIWRSAPRFGPWYGEGLIEQLRAVLRDLDRDRPLFLFLNVADAHDPWSPIPRGLDWVEPRAEGLHYFVDEEPAEWEALVSGSMSAADEAAFGDRVRDLYDYGLFRADATLGRALAEIEAHGWNSAGLRLVIVSDHGEFLGEHQLARHGRYLWEPNQRVFLLTQNLEGVDALPSDTISALVAHELVAHGRLPDPLPPVRAASYPDALWIERSHGKVGISTSAAWWQGHDKWLWRDGATSRFDLRTDGDEMAPDREGPAPPEGFVEWVRAVRASGVRDMETDPELLEALRAGGYLGDP